MRRRRPGEWRGAFAAALLSLLTASMHACASAHLDTVTGIISGSTTSSSPEGSCPKLYTGQACKAALLWQANLPSSTTVAQPPSTSLPGHCSTGDGSATAVPPVGSAPSGANPALLVKPLNGLGQAALEEHAVNLLQPFQLSAVPNYCLHQATVLLCSTLFPLYQKANGVCPPGCLHIENSCSLPWKLSRLTDSGQWMPNCTSLPDSSAVTCIDPTAVVIPQTTEGDPPAHVQCQTISSWNHTCSKPLSTVYPPNVNVSANDHNFPFLDSKYRFGMTPSCFGQIHSTLCQLAYVPDNCTNTIGVQSAWSILQSHTFNMTACVNDLDLSTHMITSNTDSSLPTSFSRASSQTVSAGPTMMSTSTAGVPASAMTTLRSGMSAAHQQSSFSTMATTSSTLSLSPSTLSTVLRASLVLGSVGGTLLLVFGIFIAIRLVRRHRVNYLRTGPKGDIENRMLTRRSSVANSISSGYSSEGSTNNERRVSRRGYTSLSEFAMTSFQGMSNDSLGICNPMFSANLNIPDYIKRLERDQIALLTKQKDVTYGKVHRAEVSELLDEELSTTVTAKVASDNCSMRQHEDFCSEVNLLALCNHDNVAQLLGVCLSSMPQMFCVEFMEYGNLHTFLREAAACIGNTRQSSTPPQRDDIDAIDFDLVGADGEMLSQCDLVHICSQVASGMAYLSQKGFVHKDLAARSCQVSAGLHVRVSDFGYGRDVHSSDYYIMGAGHDTLLPVRWTAPEAIMFGQYTTASDVWSFGVLTWEVFTFGARPYGELSNGDVIKVLTQFKSLDPPSNSPAEIHVLLGECFSKLTVERPSFASLHTQLEQLFLAMNELRSGASRVTMDSIAEDDHTALSVSVI